MISPSARASLVVGIPWRARAVLTCWRATDHAILNRWASHEETDRYWVGTPPLDLGQAPEPLRGQDIGRPFQPGEVGLEPLVVHPSQILTPQLLQRRP